MATTINLKKDNFIKKGFVGFSWTTLFFGFFVPIIRDDVKWAAIMFISLFCHFVVVVAIINNKQYTTRLLESGYEPTDEYSRGILRSKGMIA